MNYKKLEKRALRFLNRKEVKEFKQFDEAKQERILDVFAYDEAMFKNYVEAMFNDTFEYPSDLNNWKQEQEANRPPTAQEKAEIKYNEKRDKYYSKLGIDDPTEVTRNVFEKQDIMANSSKFFNAFGTMTLDYHKQLQASYFNAQLKQNLIMIAQNDELIKQNDRKIEQNDEIIDLLVKMSEQNDEANLDRRELFNHLDVLTLDIRNTIIKNK